MKSITADQAIAAEPGKPGRHTKLTPEVHTSIVQYIRGGAFDWVAAEANGIGQRTFYRWMKAGERGDKAYRQFWQDVRQARAQARVLAEVAVRAGDPFKWLRYGPGRERDGEPGWTESADVNVNGQVGVTLTWGEFVRSAGAEPDASPE
jgi:hypothetical protein